MSVGQSKCKTKTADPCIRQLRFYNAEVHPKLTVGLADGGPWVLQSEDGEVAVVGRTSRCFHQERSSVLLQMRVIYNFSKLKNRHVFSILCMGVHTCLGVHVGIRGQPIGVCSLHRYVDSRHITQVVRLVVSAVLLTCFYLYF